MALDCVSVTLSTIVKDSITATSIANLLSHGHKSEAATMKTLKYVSTHADVGGKRKVDATGNSDRKRCRVRQHRTTISKRVQKISSVIISLKGSYYTQCPFVGVILDEGNNWRRSCPVYVATITCDSQFRWRIQFVGQADCVGRKDGESIFNLVKKIFSDHGWHTVYNQIVSAGTDGASVMRSTTHFRGE